MRKLIALVFHLMWMRCIWNLEILQLIVLICSNFLFCVWISNFSKLLHRNSPFSSFTSRNRLYTFLWRFSTIFCWFVNSPAFNYIFPHISGILFIFMPCFGKAFSSILFASSFLCWFSPVCLLVCLFSRRVLSFAGEDSFRKYD